jgi:hypothetical protein
MSVIEIFRQSAAVVGGVCDPDAKGHCVPSPVSLTSATPLNLHNRFLIGGVLQTAVSKAPLCEWHIDSGVRRGASDAPLAFLDRVARPR